MALDVHRPFTREQALADGVTDAMLRGRSSYQRLFRGVYISATMEMTLARWLLAALLVAPRGSVVSHVTALRWYGYEVGGLMPLHVSARSETLTRQSGIVAHRRRGRIGSHVHGGIPVTDPERTLVDVAYDVSTPELLQAIEWMVYRGLTTVDLLAAFALEHHLRGVRRIRHVIALVREGAESPMETRVRLMIRCAHLPEPRCNVVLRDAHGLFLARGDLVLERWKVLVEYDGWHHERDGHQRQRDIGRRERLEAAGWRVIVVTAADLASPRTIVTRVHHALGQHGYTGPAPVFSIMWDTWFPTRRAA